MTEENPRAVIGGNAPPDPIDTITASHADIMAEVANWADGSTVETLAQMTAVDLLIKEMKGARKELDAARDAATKPLHEVWKAEIARWKPTQDDYDRQVACLVAAVDPFKRNLAREQDEARRKAEAEAWEKTRAAQEAFRAAGAADLDAQRIAAQAEADAIAAQEKARIAAESTVKGMRRETLHEVTDHKALLNWIAQNDRPAMTAFIEAYAKANYKTKTLPGVRTWEDRKAV